MLARALRISLRIIQISLINLSTLTVLIVTVFKGIVKSNKKCYNIIILSQVYGKEKIRALCKQ